MRIVLPVSQDMELFERHGDAVEERHVREICIAALDRCS